MHITPCHLLLILHTAVPGTQLRDTPDYPMKKPSDKHKYPVEKPLDTPSYPMKKPVPLEDNEMVWHHVHHDHVGQDSDMNRSETIHDNQKKSEESEVSKESGKDSFAALLVTLVTNTAYTSISTDLNAAWLG